MANVIEPIARLAAQLGRLPGIGAKTAMRLAYHLLSVPEEQALELAEAIACARQEVHACPICGGYTDVVPCALCSDPKRENAVICVVRDARDIAAMEKSREFRGRYHVLGGLISPLDGVGPEDIRIEELLARIREGGVEEVILATSGYKIIRTANLSLETRNFDADLAYIKQKVNVMGGYVSNSFVNGRKPENYGDAGRYANMTIRIPQERMEAFLADARGIATVISESTGGEDITAAYFDTESRLSVYTAQRERILTLLETADDMEDVIALEQEHARLTYEIESLTTQVRRWDDLVDMATVHIDLNELPPASANVSDDSFGTRVSEGIRQTFASMSVFFENLLVTLIVISPVLLLIAVLVIVIVLLRRRRRRKQGVLLSRKERRAAKKAKMTSVPEEESTPQPEDEK